MSSGCEPPLLLWDLGDVSQSQHTQQPAIVGNEEAVLPAVQDLIVDDLADRREAGHTHAVPVHDLADFDILQVMLHIGLSIRCRSRVLQEPADEGQPGAVQEIALDDAQDAKPDKAKGHKLPGERSYFGGLMKIFFPPPDDGAQHTAAIQREPGDQVEGCQDEIDAHQVSAWRREVRDLLIQ